MCSQYSKLTEAAEAAMKNAYAPYSGFFVGAALKAEDGQIFTGCNIENSAYSPTNCAERTAFFKAISEGARHFEAIAIVGGKNGVINDFCPPCGVCRQVMQEFCNGDFKIILKGPVESKIYLLKDLLPQGFGPNQVK